MSRLQQWLCCACVLAFASLKRWRCDGQMWIDVDRGSISDAASSSNTRMSVKQRAQQKRLFWRIAYSHVWRHGERERSSVPQMIGCLRAPSSSGNSRTLTAELNRNLHAHHKRRASIAWALTLSGTPTAQMMRHTDIRTTIFMGMWSRMRWAERVSR